MTVLYRLLIFLLASAAFAQDADTLAAEAATEIATEAAIEAAIKPMVEAPKTISSAKGWVKIFAYTAAVACAGVSAYKHYGTRKDIDGINELKSNPPSDRYSPEGERWLNRYNTKENDLRKKEMQRNIFGATAIYLAVTGTFFF